MGVNVFILDRRPSRLTVAGAIQDAGSLRRSWKLTELDEKRSSRLAASEALAAGMPSLRVAILADVSEMPLGTASSVPVKAHLVIGWDDGRTRVTDLGWDYLPVLGYAVRDPESGVFVLHEERDHALHRLDRERAVELGLVGPDGQLVPHGQPLISECRSVRPYIFGFAEADCTFADGRQEKLLIKVVGAELEFGITNVPHCGLDRERASSTSLLGFPGSPPTLRPLRTV